METACGLSALGIGIYRAGLWKPRTLPGGFEGVGSVGLPWLRHVREKTGMLTATEIANRHHAERALDGGVDILWIGARTSANPFAMQEIADILAEKHFQGPVLVKNPVNPDLELWIGALQRLYNAGIRRLGAIHRGFTAYGAHMYRNVPHWHIALELRPPLSAAACDLRSEPHRRAARVDRPVVAAGAGHGFRGPDNREPLHAGRRMERRHAAGHSRRIRPDT